MAAKQETAQKKPETVVTFDERVAQYRADLLKLEQDMQREYDKAVMALSGGAFGISLTFLKEVIAGSPIMMPSFLLSSWLCWGSSVACVLFSYFTSTLALRAAIKQTDNHTLYLKSQKLGGRYDLVTKILNFLGGILFLTGVISIVLFVSSNLMTPKSNLPNPKQPTVPGKPNVGQIVPPPPPVPRIVGKGQVVPPPPPPPTIR
jgi:hypothetical protein